MADDNLMMQEAWLSAIMILSQIAKNDSGPGAFCTNVV